MIYDGTKLSEWVHIKGEAVVYVCYLCLLVRHLELAKTLSRGLAFPVTILSPLWDFLKKNTLETTKYAAFPILQLYTGAQITHGGQVQRRREDKQFQHWHF